MDHQVVKGGGGGKQVQQQSGYGGVGMKRSESEMVLEELIRMMMIAGSTPDAAPNHHPTPSTTTITSSSPPSTLQNQINTHGHHQMLLDIYDDHLLSFLSADNESSSSIFDNDQYPNHYNDCIHPRPQFHQETDESILLAANGKSGAASMLHPNQIVSSCHNSQVFTTGGIGPNCYTPTSSSNGKSKDQVAAEVITNTIISGFSHDQLLYSDDDDDYEDDENIEAGQCEQSSITNQNHDPANIDVKRDRRKISNRESAKRSRKKKQDYQAGLEMQVEMLRGENESLIKQLGDASHLYRDAGTHNHVLQSQVEALRAKVKLAEDRVGRSSFPCNVNHLLLQISLKSQTLASTSAVPNHNNMTAIRYNQNHQQLLPDREGVSPPFASALVAGNTSSFTNQSPPAI